MVYRWALSDLLCAGHSRSYMCTIHVYPGQLARRKLEEANYGVQRFSRSVEEYVILSRFRIKLSYQLTYHTMIAKKREEEHNVMECGTVNIC